jgi:hypothetical protein
MHTLSAPWSLSAQLRRLAALAALAASAGAHANGGVTWSVNVDLPVAPSGRVVTAVSNAPAPVVVYRSEPVYDRMPVYGGRQVVYTQVPPVHVHPQPVYAQPRPVYQGPARVVYAPAPVVVVKAPHHGHHPHWRGHVRPHHESRFGMWQGWGGGERRMIVPRDDRGRDGHEGRDDHRGRDGRGDDQRGGLRHHH